MVKSNISKRFCDRLNLTRDIYILYGIRIFLTYRLQNSHVLSSISPKWYVVNSIILILHYYHLRICLFHISLRKVKLTTILWLTHHERLMFLLLDTKVEMQKGTVLLSVKEGLETLCQTFVE